MKAITRSDEVGTDRVAVTNHAALRDLRLTSTMNPRHRRL